MQAITIAFFLLRAYLVSSEDYPLYLGLFYHNYLFVVVC